MKTIIRHSLVAIMVTMMATSVFTGCKKDDSSSSVDGSVISTESAEVTTFDENFVGNLYDTIEDKPIEGLPESIASFEANNGISDSYIFRNWYDTISPDLEDIDTGIEMTTSESVWKKYFNIYSDKKSEFIISGKSRVDLEDDDMSPLQRRDLRSEEGVKYYIVDDSRNKSLSDGTDEFTAGMKDFSGVQPETMDEREVYDESLTSKAPMGAVCVNNVKSSYMTTRTLIPYSAVNELFPELMSFGTDGNFSTIILHTANGDQTYAIDFIGNSYMAIARPDGSRLMVDNFEVMGDDVYLPADILEYTFGWQIEVYEDFVNIVTDQKDLVDADKSNLILKSSLVDIPAEVGSKIGKARFEPHDKDYLAEDIAPFLRKDYYIFYTKLEASNPNALPESISKMNDWNNATKYFKISDMGVSSPSLIPWSEITEDNITEAFPMQDHAIGYLPYTPLEGFMELYPDMSKEKALEWVMKFNLEGSSYRPFTLKTDEEYELYMNDLLEKGKELDEVYEEIYGAD